ncbi:MAG: hypothetical protein Q7S95_02925 [bacterium]|nr:hypothetical protein [bacterium]
MPHKSIAVLYHGGCPDGLGSAYAAWKKLGEEAEYIPVKHDRPIPEGLEGKRLYLLDFCYNTKEDMARLEALSSGLTIIDHHEGAKEVIESVGDHVYDAAHSGAGLAWMYFHPDDSLPYFLSLVEKADLYQPLSEDERAIITYCYAQPFNFHTWDEHVRRMDDPEEREAIIERGNTYAEYFSLITDQFEHSAELVSFEGYTVYLAAGERMFITELGARLREKQPPFALIARVSAVGIRVSLRGDGSVDVAKIAQKYGGNGHPNSAAFTIFWGAPIPWQPLPEETRP